MSDLVNIHIPRPNTLLPHMLLWYYELVFMWTLFNRYMLKLRCILKRSEIVANC